MKKVLVLVLSFVMLTACASVKDESEYPSGSVGNSYGNIVNGGFAAYNDGWVYYNSFDNKCFYKMREDGTEKTKLADQSACYINVADGWIYYCYYKDYRNTAEKEGSGIFRMRTDGSENTRIADDIVAVCMNVSGEWIYYIESGGVYKTRLDGSEKTRVTDGNINYINVDGDWIYYTAGINGDLCKIRTDGTGKTLLRLMDDVFYSGYIITAGDWIYYMPHAFDDTFSIYKIRTDGTENTLVISWNDIWGIDFNIADGWIYYTGWCDETNSHPIHKMRLDGSEKTRLSEHDAGAINIAGGWIIYAERNPYDNFCKMRLDGTDNQLLD